MTNTVSMRAVAAALAVTTAVWLVGAALVVPTAHGATIEELLAQIADLQAQVLALGGGTSASGACYAYTRDLTLGSTGGDVSELQGYLAGQLGPAASALKNVFANGVAKGYFGPLTQAALAEYQAANAISPPAGYFGPITRGHLTTVCGTSGEEGSSESGPLSGGEGFFGSFEVLGDPSSETVYEEDEQKVLGVQYEAEDSDLRVERARVRFWENATKDDKPWKYFDEVILFHGDEEVARESADSSSDWSDISTTTSKVYEKTFTGLDEVTRENDEDEWYVGVMSANSIDSANDGAVWNVSFETDSVRAVGATGVDVYGPSSQLTTTFTIDTSAQGKLELGSPSGDENDDRVQAISDTTETPDVTLFTWTMEAKEGDVLITDLAADFASSSSYSNTADVGQMISSATLYRGSDKVKTESVASTVVDSTVTWDKIDETIDSGDKETWSIKAKVRQGATATFAEGDALQVNIDNADVTSEAANGDSVTATGGTVTGGVVAFYTEGVKLAHVSSSAVKSIDGSAGATDDQGKFTIVFDVTAFGSDIYIPKNATSATIGAGSTTGVEYSLTTTGALTYGESSVTTWSGNDGSNGTYKLVNGATKRLTLEVYVTASTGSESAVYAALDRLVWATSDTTTSAGAYNFDLSAFKTGSVSLIPR